MKPEELSACSLGPQAKDKLRNERLKQELLVLWERQPSDVLWIALMAGFQRRQIGFMIRSILCLQTPSAKGFV